ncbi:hypothetical protein MPSI1_003471 [Malassezia psittaci]|uniref:Protein YAE1 n=1 Tax=Malassezia psittaci TaxID=1821823 RepID=A0AAF0F9I3_9BASI|nr:hypothetical protein MPSI1_003471 [Malassezia psittaci]
MDDDWLASDDEEHYVEHHRLMEQRDRKKMESQFFNIGYTEGLEQGKLAHLQRGFDHGYNTVGMQVGRSFGQIRGSAHSLMHILAKRLSKASHRSSSHTSEELKKLMSEVQSFCAEFDAIKLEQIAEPDWENVQHEAEHHSQDDTDSYVAEKREEWRKRKDLLDTFQTRLTDLEKRTFK